MTSQRRLPIGAKITIGSGTHFRVTWMDAKVDNWVVTPRRGKAVELNALWYNALRLLETWLREEGDEAGGYLYDVIDGEQGDDASCRPNQILAIALDHPILDSARWQPVLDVVEAELLTPVGLRSLSQRHSAYKPTYSGDLLSRDAAYHQGTVWGWLIGPYIDAWRKVNTGRDVDARLLLSAFEQHLDESGLGSISEIFDAEAPYTPRGCIAQAWSVAEVLRCWKNTAPP